MLGSTDSRVQVQLGRLGAVFICGDLELALHTSQRDLPERDSLSEISIYSGSRVNTHQGIVGVGGGHGGCSFSSQLIQLASGHPLVHTHSYLLCHRNLQEEGTTIQAAAGGQSLQDAAAVGRALCLMCHAGFCRPRPVKA